MIIEYIYKIENNQEFIAATGLALDTITFAIDFTASTSRDAKGVEVGELNVTNVEMLYAATDDGVPIMLNRKQKERLEELVDYRIIDLACWEAWGDKEKTTRRHTDEDRIN